MRSILGLVNFYRAFIPSLSMYTKSLSLSLTKTHPSNIVWTSEMLSDFDSIVSCICEHSSLTIPTPEDVFSLSSDAPSKGVGGVLCLQGWC